MRAFWYLGATVLVVFLALGRRRIDYRVVLVAALLPDLIDAPLGRWLFPGEFDTSRLFAHTFAFALVMLLGIQIFLRGARARRWFVLPIAVLVHLALDGMYNDPVTLFWPLFSPEFPSLAPAASWLEVIFHPLDHPVEAIKEVVGLALLLYMGYAFELHRREGLRAFVRTGSLSNERHPAQGSTNGQIPLR